jgi:DNA-binding transcriptional regulator/RsmH inhibitor MraZ
MIFYDIWIFWNWCHFVGKGAKMALWQVQKWVALLKTTHFGFALNDTRPAMLRP